MRFLESVVIKSERGGELLKPQRGEENRKNIPSYSFICGKLKKNLLFL